MKKHISILIALVAIGFTALSQAIGDYRSVGNGNWNDVTKWEMYDGSNWINAPLYPGQSPGTGVVTIRNETEIKITATVPNAISSLYISVDFGQVLPSGSLVFSSQNPISLNVVGDMEVYGNLLVADQSGAKSHSIILGGSLTVGTAVYVPDTTCIDYWDYCSCPGNYVDLYATVQTLNNDDKLALIFNTTKPNSWITGNQGIAFQDITFNGIGISLGVPIYISGTASFINGIVSSGDLCGITNCIQDACGPPCHFGPCVVMFFTDGAHFVGASSNSFVDGRVWKEGNDPFTFPIGNNGIYSPLTISAPPNQEEVLSARYVRSSDPPLWGITDPVLYNVSSCEYWELNVGTPGNATNFGTNHTNYGLDVTVGWSTPSSCGPSSNINAVSDVTLAHFNGTSWNSHGGAATGDIVNGTITWAGISDFDLFALGNINTNCVAPSGLTTLNVTAKSAILNWSPVPGATSYDVSFKPITMTIWSNITAVTSTSLILSGLNPLLTYDWKVRANCSVSLSAYRFGPEFTTPIPCGTPSGLSTTNIASSSATLNWVAVANAVNYTVIYKQSNAPYWTTAASGITSLSFNLSGLSALTGYEWGVIATCSEGSGNYAQASFTTLATPPCVDLYESNNTSNQAKTISSGMSISANISSTTDVDWFKVTMPNNSNTTLQVTLNNLPADYDLYVYNKNSVLVASSINAGTSNELVVYSSRTRNVTYYIKVIGKNGAFNASQCYSLLAQAVASTRSITSASSDRHNEMTETSNETVLYPNPASEFVYLRFNSSTEGMSEIRIENATGQLVKKYPIKISIGYNLIRVPAYDISPGMYILRIKANGINTASKFVIFR